MPLDSYSLHPVKVMQRVPSDSDLPVPAYEGIARVCSRTIDDLHFVERSAFYEMAREAFVIVQTDDRTMYANVVLTKGVM